MGDNSLILCMSLLQAKKKIIRPTLIVGVHYNILFKHMGKTKTLFKLINVQIKHVTMISNHQTAKIDDIIFLSQIMNGN